MLASAVFTKQTQKNSRGVYDPTSGAIRVWRPLQKFSRFLLHKKQLEIEW